MLSDLIKKAQELSNLLMLSPACLQKTKCIPAEQERALSKGEKSLGWTQRPWDAFDPDRLCLACRAYWHSASATNALNRLDLIEKRMAAHKEMK